jgi:hypothetical protein
VQDDVLWQAANHHARDIVMKLLERDPSKRITAEAALQHPWLNADMRVSRQVAADVEDAVLTKRSRLQQQAKQAHIEEFMKLMSLVRPSVIQPRGVNMRVDFCCCVQARLYKSVTWLYRICCFLPLEALLPLHMCPTPQEIQ